MPHRPEGPGEDKSSGMGISKGVFAREVEVARIDNKSNHPTRDHFSFDSGFEPQLCLQVHYTDGDYDGSVMVFGKYIKDKENIIKRWNNQFNGVQRFLHFTHSTIKYIEDDFSISDETLEKYAGRKFIVVKYQSNSEYFNESKGEEDYRMQTWNKVFAAGTDIEEIRKEWSQNVDWIKDYAPDIWEMKQQKKNTEKESFNYGANKNEANESKEEDII